VAARRVDAVSECGPGYLAVSGDGPGVVLTHGFADDSRTFDLQVAHLAARYTLAAWDLPGHGSSPVGPIPASRDTALAGLDRAIEAVGPGPVTLIGHSLGGYMSMCRALLRPDGIAGLVLLSTGPGFRDRAKREAWNERISAYAASRGVPPLAVGTAIQADSLVLENLGEIDVPALLIVGGDDSAYLAGYELISRSLPDARLLVVEGAGHFPHQTHADEVNAAIGEFLSRISPASDGPCRTEHERA
jgi:pimeloyl-ACP methyl ester carboxylesterase